MTVRLARAVVSLSLLLILAPSALAGSWYFSPGVGISSIDGSGTSNYSYLDENGKKVVTRFQFTGDNVLGLVHFDAARDVSPLGFHFGTNNFGFLMLSLGHSSSPRYRQHLDAGLFRKSSFVTATASPATGTIQPYSYRQWKEAVWQQFDLRYVLDYSPIPGFSSWYLSAGFDYSNFQAIVTTSRYSLEYRSQMYTDYSSDVDRGTMLGLLLGTGFTLKHDSKGHELFLALTYVYLPYDKPLKYPFDLLKLFQSGHGLFLHGGSYEFSRIEFILGMRFPFGGAE